MPFFPAAAVRSGFKFGEIVSGNDIHFHVTLCVQEIIRGELVS